MLDLNSLTVATEFDFAEHLAIFMADVAVKFINSQEAVVCICTALFSSYIAGIMSTGDFIGRTLVDVDG